VYWICIDGIDPRRIRKMVSESLFETVRVKF
jgi:hypothetical protein